MLGTFMILPTAEKGAYLEAIGEGSEQASATSTSIGYRICEGCLAYLNLTTYGQKDKKVERRPGLSLSHEKCMEVNTVTGQLIEHSSLLVGMGLEEGTTAAVALIMLPINMQSYQHETLQRFVEMARERAKTNGWGKLQIVCARKVDLWTERPTAREEEERAEEEGIRQILLSLPQGSCAIPSAESELVKVLTLLCYEYSHLEDKLTFVMANMRLNNEGRELYENLEVTEEDEISANVVMEPPPSKIKKTENKHYDSIQNFIKSLCSVSEHGGRAYEQSQSECVAGESKTTEFMEALKSSGIRYLLIHNNNNISKAVVDDLHGKAIGFFICHFQIFECIKLQKIYKDLQQKDSNFIWIWIPTLLPKYFGYGSYTRLIQCMPWATFPDPHLVNVEARKPCFVLLDEHGQIANHDALPLLMAWGVNSYPFTQHTIPESFLSVESESCLEFLLHGMNIVGRKQMKSKMTFLYVQDPHKWLEKKSMLEELTQIHGSFEVLYVGKSDHNSYGQYFIEGYEDATQNMCWLSLAFSDMLTFWSRCQYLANKKMYELFKESNIMMESLHGLAKHLYGLWGGDERGRLVLVDNDGVVTCGGDEVVQTICESSDKICEGEGMGMRMVKDELMKCLSEGGCSPLVRTIFRDEIDNFPQHPQHRISLTRLCIVCWCNVCHVRFDHSDQGRAYGCAAGCDWDMCRSCWMAYAKQQVQQLLRAKENELCSHN